MNAVDVEQMLREAIARDGVPSGHNPPSWAWEATDALLALRIPQACQTCKGGGYVVNFDVSGVRSCTACPTIGDLLRWGWNVSQAEPDHEYGSTDGVVQFDGFQVTAVGLLAALREVPR